MTVTVHQPLVQENTARSNMLDKAVKTRSERKFLIAVSLSVMKEKKIFQRAESHS